MRKLRQCEEIVTGPGKPTYRFSGTMGNIEAASFLAGDPYDLFLRLSDNKLPVADIRAVITSTLVDIDGREVSEVERPVVVEAFLNDFGLQDCSVLSRHLISHAVIGTVKKKQIERKELIKGLTKRYNPLTLIPSVRRGWLWAAALTALAVPACTILM